MAGPQSTAIATVKQWDRETLNVIKQLIAPNCSDAELSLFQKVCMRTQLDPFTNQIRAMKRKSKGKNGEWEEKLSIMTGIDGFRVIALRTGEYMGQDGPEWCGPDGVWREVWLENFEPSAARVSVHRKGFDKPVTVVARWGAYAQYNGDGELTKMWLKMGDFMLGKCAEALALRKAFPQEISGLYTEDEISDADIIVYNKDDGSGTDNNQQSRIDNRQHQQQTRSQTNKQNNSKQTQQKKNDQPKDNRTREEKMISYWSKVDFSISKQFPDPIGTQLHDALSKMDLKNNELKFAPLDDDTDPSVVGYVAERIELGEQEEWSSLSKSRVDLACKEVVNWIQLCLPKKDDKAKESKPADQPQQDPAK